MPELAELCAGCVPCLVEPKSYLVAYSGVLALTFRGFPEPLARLKQRVAEAYGLQAEAPGSQFPKCSLGALRDPKRGSPAGFQAISGDFGG